MNNKGHRYITLLVVCCAAFLLMPALLRHGMFMDGTQYAIVARNMAEGKGSFWLPFLSSAWEKQMVNPFLEHPPLVFFLQAQFFKLFGDHFLTERIYCLMMFVISWLLISKIWKLLYREDYAKRELHWLAALFWLIVPSVFWSFSNNMQENTVTVFVLLSVLFYLQSFIKKQSIVFVLLSAISVVFASLCKGLPGLFPLILPLLHYLVYRTTDIWRPLRDLSVFFMTIATTYFLLWLSSSDARFALEFYVKERLMRRIENSPQVDSHWMVIWWLVTDLLVPILPVLLIMIVTGRRSSILSNENKKSVLFFVLLMAAGVIPLTFTLVQRAVYYVPAVPFAAIALACLVSDRVKDFMRSIEASPQKWNLLKAVSYFSVLAALIVSLFLYGKKGRDEGLLQTTDNIAKRTGTNCVVGTCYDVYYRWDLNFYLLRYKHITLEPLPPADFKYRLLEDTCHRRTLENYSLDAEPGENLKLYKKIN